MKWLLAILIACAVVLLIFGAMSAMTSFAILHPIAVVIIASGIVLAAVATFIRQLL